MDGEGDREYTETSSIGRFSIDFFFFIKLEIAGGWGGEGRGRVRVHMYFDSLFCL